MGHHDSRNAGSQAGTSDQRRTDGIAGGVRLDGTIVADTTSALTLRESTYPPVQYIPIADVHQSVLRRTATTSYCPFKGDASYYSIVTLDRELPDVIWSYEQPRPAVSAIAGHVAFYPQHVELAIGDEP